MGHFTNDLIFSVWNAYATLYLNKAVELPDYYSGLAVLLAQATDAICEPIVGHISDRTETRFGKRIPFYLLGHIIALPAFYFVFNPPDSAIGENEDDPDPNYYFFLIVPSFMTMG